MIHVFSAICTGALLAMFYRIAMKNAESHAFLQRRARGERLVFAGALLGAWFCSYLALPFHVLAGLIVLVAALAVCVITDLRFGYVFDVVTFPTIVLLLGCGYVGDAFLTTLEGGAVCAFIILLIYALSGGRGIGLGDLKLAACIGLTFGVFGGLMAIGVSFIIGAAHGVVLLLGGRARRNDPMPFAPYLAVGSAAAAVLSWYVV